MAEWVAIVAGCVMPQEGDEVWVCSPDSVGRLIVQLGVYGWNRWRDIYGDNDGCWDDTIYGVTHWQPVVQPEPPQED